MGNLNTDHKIRKKLYKAGKSWIVVACVVGGVGVVAMSTPIFDSGNVQVVHAATNWTWDNMSDAQKAGIKITNHGVPTLSSVPRLQTVALDKTTATVTIPGGGLFAKGDTLIIPFGEISLVTESGKVGMLGDYSVNAGTSTGTSPIVAGVSTKMTIGRTDLTHKGNELILPLNDDSYDPQRAYSFDIANMNTTSHNSISVTGVSIGANVSDPVVKEVMRIGNDTYDIPVDYVSATGTVTPVTKANDLKWTDTWTVPYGNTNFPAWRYMYLSMYDTDLNSLQNVGNALMDGSGSFVTAYRGTVTTGSVSGVPRLFTSQHQLATVPFLGNYTDSNGDTLGLNSGYENPNYAGIQTLESGATSTAISRNTDVVVPVDVASEPLSDVIAWAKENVPANSYVSVQTKDGWLIIDNWGNMASRLASLYSLRGFTTSAKALSYVESFQFKMTDSQINSIVDSMETTKSDGTTVWAIPNYFHVQIVGGEYTLMPNVDTTTPLGYKIERGNSYSGVNITSNTSNPSPVNTVVGQNVATVKYVDTMTGNVIHSDSLLAYTDGKDVSGVVTPTFDDPNGTGHVTVPKTSLDGYSVVKTLTDDEKSKSTEFNNPLASPGDDIDLDSDKSLTVALKPNAASISIKYQDPDGKSLGSHTITGFTGSADISSWDLPNHYAYVSAVTTGESLSTSASGLTYTMDGKDDTTSPSQSVVVTLSRDAYDKAQGSIDGNKNGRDDGLNGRPKNHSATGDPVYNDAYQNAYDNAYDPASTALDDYVRTQYPKSGSVSKASIGLLSLASLAISGFAMTYKRKHS